MKIRKSQLNLTALRLKHLCAREFCQCRQGFLPSFGIRGSLAANRHGEERTARVSAGVKSEIDIEDLRREKIISFSRQNLSYSERYFAKKFEEHDLTDEVGYTRDDTFSLMSLVSAGLGVGFVPEWTQDLPNHGFDLKKVRGIDFRIGLVVAWNREDPTAARDGIIDIARSRCGRAGEVTCGKSGR